MAEAAKKNVSLLTDLLTRIARKPTVEDLWGLRGPLLACSADHPDALWVGDLSREFYLYLSELRSKMTARQYNELASRLDMSAVGTLALQDILLEQEELFKSLLLGGLGEGLMVMASRQYIKAWEQELQAVHRQAAWVLYGVLWELSRKHQPDMAPGERQRFIESSLAPALDSETSSEAKMLLLIRLFQVALLIVAVPLCTAIRTQSKA